MTEKIITYEPDNSLKKGYLSIFGEIFREFKENQWLIFQLFKRDFLALYKQSLIGILWAFIIPIVSVGTFVILNLSGIFVIGDIAAPYPIYAILGMAIWQLFSVGLVASSNSLVSAGPMIVKINFSKKSLVVASIGRAFVSFFIQFALVILLFIFYAIFFPTYRFVPSIFILLIPILVIPIILLTLGLGFMLSLMNAVVRDVSNALSVGLTFLMLLTPVLYAKPTTGVLAYITLYNPLYYLVSTPRDIILTGTISEWPGFLSSFIFSVVIFMLCLVAFHLTETRVAERI